MNQNLKPSNTIEKDCDVCIIGDGFAGLNTARLMVKGNFKTNIVSLGTGASNFWLGSVNILKSIDNSKGFNFNSFIKNNPKHPFQFTNSELIQEALKEFYSEMSELTPFRNEDSKFTNKHILSPFGTMKQTNGKWNSIFSDFKNLKENAEVYLVDFKEFDLSSMNLVAKGLMEKFKGDYQVIEVSLKEVFEKIKPNFFTKSYSAFLSPKMVANFFDSNKENMDPLIDIIRPLIYKKEPTTIDPIRIILFPPIMGLLHNDLILKNISLKLDCQTYELISLTPSIIAERLNLSFKKRIDNKNSLIKMDKGYALKTLIKTDEGFNCVFENKKHENMMIHSKYVIIACGSIFAEGQFKLFIENSLPNESDVQDLILSKNFELVSTEVSKDATSFMDTGKIFAAGSSIFLFSPEITDDDEILNETGMGTVIIPAYQIFKELTKIE
ncbi:Anaerobic glycerol-3-phosphate dehydrogenase subunit B [Candidatus Lokiarchaeum ossiferum]|uniref:Anaerobic glycerol-3-phosphate dehydrogenase subunit B n=1 Tax=Candidatus Lokiarchaeum ossiferum TaxID=2951803 RepID=A0ABY6HLZ7_9ARCH|nr:Anaerobic glycerol-3-phosphate dehydrogenase subunit B [Candidatus Lokiarchaeum sp. B-35]